MSASPTDPGVPAGLVARSVSNLVRWAQVGVAGCMVVQVLQLVGVVDRFDAPHRAGFNLGGTMGLGEPSTVLTAVWMLLVLGSGGLVIAAFHRAYCNRTAFGLELPGSPRWFLWSWFVPIANAYVPYEISKRCWEGVTPGGRPQVLKWWWFVWVLSFFHLHGYAAPAPGSDVLVLSGPYRAWDAAVVLVLGGLTLAVLTRLRDDQERASATAAHRYGPRGVLDPAPAP